MAKNAITDYDTDPNNNTDVGDIGVQGTNIPSNFDNSQREIMSHLADMNAGTSPLHDTFSVADPADLTKKARIDAGHVTAGQTRIISMGDEDVTLVADDRNLVINSNFAVNVRGVSGTVVLAAGDYGHDQWKAGSSGCTYTFATVENVTTITITAGSLQQIIPGTNLYSGTHSLSWAGTAQGKIDSGSYSSSGLTGTATGGTNLTIEFNTGTLSQVTLNKGPTALPYKSEDIEIATARCQQYACIVGMTMSTATLPYDNTAFFPVEMAAQPVVSLISGGVNGATIAPLTHSTKRGIRQITAASNWIDAGFLCVVEL